MSRPGAHTHPLLALLGPTPPAWLRALEARVLMRGFARAFDVEAPSLRGLSAEAALLRYRAFTAACLEMASQDPQLSDYLRPRLGAEAQRLGTALRRLMRVRRDQALPVAAYLYRGIGIGLTGSLPGELRFEPCAFAACYTPRACLLMSAFDEGLLRGVSGAQDARLLFSCRLTEGAPCCRARME